MYPYTSFCGNAARRFVRRAAPRCAFGAALLASLIGALLAAPPAQAALGGAPMPTPAGASAITLSAASAAAATGNAAAVARAAVQAAASGASATSAYTVAQTTLANGTVVREYLTQAGTVFGVAWDGPQMPNLATLLGSYFPQYTAGVKASHAAGLVRGPGVVENANVIVHSGGHMGAFSGQAWLPQALPAGVSGSDIQ